jgi:Zn-dependent M28 family amino/carboxypeptidase
MAGSKLLSEAVGVDFRKLEQKLAQLDSQKPIGSIVLISINLQVVVDTLHVSNILGVLPGYDTTQTVILGAHYDHLGKRGTDIYYGSDDNASGVAGLLALAKMWAVSSTIPPYNIVFASWTAEEKGLIGSKYFTSSLAAPEKVKLYINMDMISRSVMEDTAQRQLSIGTRTTDENIREIARKSNATLNRPFELDLWDVTGHSGSDYASFTAKNIPIMTYNTGLHNDYHTPRDIPANADLIKMGDVLKVVNACVWEFMLMR